MTEADIALEYVSLVVEAMDFTDNVDEALLAADIAMGVQTFSLSDPKAQSVLDEATRKIKNLSRRARKALEKALGHADRGEMALAIVRMVEEFRYELASLLGAAQLTALLRGAQEIAKELPVVVEDVEEFPVLDEAIKSLAERGVVTRDVYDLLDSASRQKAFTVAGVSARETLEKVRDALVENLREGVDLASFREKVLAVVEPGTFLSAPHLETILRNAVQREFSDGQMAVLSHPVVKDGFPYASYDAIHDDRVRHNHLSLEKYGIDGTNVYRVDDPVFRIFRPPWDYSDRCGWTCITIEQAAKKGIAEAKQWLETGVEPSPPAFVKMPPFLPPPAFMRNVAFSVQLSTQSLEDWGMAFGMVGDEWHGPKPPGDPANWVAAPKGPRGGMRWKLKPKEGGGEEPTGPKPAAKKPVVQKPRTERGVKVDVPTIVARVKADIAKGITDTGVEWLADEFLSMRVADILEIKRQLGLKGSGNKAELAKKVAQRAKEESDKTLHEAPKAEEYKEVANQPKKPFSPIKDQLDAYTNGDEKVKAIASLGNQADHWQQESDRLKEQVDKLYEKRKNLKTGKLGKIDSANLKRLHDAQYQAEIKQREASKQMRDMIRKTFGAKAPMSIEYDMPQSPSQPWDNSSKAAVTAAHEFIGAMLEKGGFDKGVNTRVLPLSGNQKRAFYTPGTGTMMVRSAFENSATIVHEWGHNIEDVVPGVTEACQEFLKYRLKGEKPQRLQELFPQRNYESWEVGAKDEFDKAFGDSGWYVGKIYPGGMGSEVLSMGLELLYNDPAKFARRDPEYCKFVLGVLDGTIR